MLQANPAVKLRDCDNTTLVIDPAALGSVAVDSVIVGVLDTFYTAGPSECSLFVRRVTAVTTSPGGLVIETVPASLGDIFFSADFTFPDATTTELVPPGLDIAPGISLSNTTASSGRGLLSSAAVRGHAVSQPKSFADSEGSSPKFDIGLDLDGFTLPDPKLQFRFLGAKFLSSASLRVYKAPGSDSVTVTYTTEIEVGVSFSATIEQIKDEYNAEYKLKLGERFFLIDAVVPIPITVDAQVKFSGKVIVEGDYEKPVEITGGVSGGPSFRAGLTCSKAGCQAPDFSGDFELQVTGSSTAQGLCTVKFTLEVEAALGSTVSLGFPKANIELFTLALKLTPSVAVAFRTPDDSCPCVDSKQQSSQKKTGELELDLEVGREFEAVGLTPRYKIPLGKKDFELGSECLSGVKLADCELGKCNKDKSQCGDKKAGAAKHSPLRKGRHLMQTDEQDAISALQVTPYLLAILNQSHSSISTHL